MVTSTIGRDIFIGRQPIYNRRLECIGYELLYRAGDVQHACVSDGTQASSEVILHAFLDMGLQNLVGKRVAFIKLPRNLLLSQLCTLLPPGAVWLEIQGNSVVDDEMLKTVRELHSRGYRIALDDYLSYEQLQPLVGLADIVRIDVSQLRAVDLAAHLAEVRPYPGKLLAEKVENREQFRTCAAAGFEYFQGFFLCRPDVVKGGRLPPSRAAALQLLKQVNDPVIDVRELAKIIRRDPSLTHRMLRAINSAGMAVSQTVESVDDALLLLGMDYVAKLASLVVLAGVDDQPRELLTTAMVRARMCELLGAAAGKEHAGTLFLVGMYSAMDAMMGITMETVLGQVPLAPKVRAALVAQEGFLGEVLHCVLAFERGDWAAVEASALGPGAIQQSYLQALAWSGEMVGRIG